MGKDIPQMPLVKPEAIKKPDPLIEKSLDDLTKAGDIFARLIKKGTVDPVVPEKAVSEETSGSQRTVDRLAKVREREEFIKKREGKK